MFVLDCAECGGRRLVGVRRVRAIRNLSRGLIAVELFCLCGAPATVVTGNRSRRSAGSDWRGDRDPPALEPHRSGSRESRTEPGDDRQGWLVSA